MCIYIYITQLVIWHVFKGNLEWNLEIRKLVWISKWATQNVKQWNHWLVLHVNQTINGWLLVRKAVIYTRLLYADCQTSFMIAIYDTCLSQGASVFTVTSLWFPAPLRSECCHKFDSELWRRVLNVWSVATALSCKQNQNRKWPLSDSTLQSYEVFLSWSLLSCTSQDKDDPGNLDHRDFMIYSNQRCWGSAVRWRDVRDLEQIQEGRAQIGWRTGDVTACIYALCFRGNSRELLLLSKPH